MSNTKKSDKIKSDILINAIKDDKLEIESLCKEFDMMNPKNHKRKFGA